MPAREQAGPPYDAAVIELGANQYSLRSLLNNEPAVGIQVFQSTDASAIAVAMRSGPQAGLSLVDAKSANVENYVTEKALDGLFKNLSISVAPAAEIVAERIDAGSGTGLSFEALGYPVTEAETA